MRIRLFAAIAIFMLALPFAAKADENWVKTYTTSGKFSDVSLDLKNAIINHGYVVDYHGFISDMLKRTGKDIGSSKTVYENAEFYQFCSAALSRAAMEADPNAIGFCPYAVFAYQLPGDKKVYVGYRLAPKQGSEALQKAFATIDAELDKIVKDAIE